MAHIHLHIDLAPLVEAITQGTKIMAAIDDLRTEIAGIRTNIGELATGISGVSARIDTLIANAANGVDAAGAAELLNELQGIKNDLQAQEDAANALANPPA